MNLRRSNDDRHLAGVCGGLAKHFDLPSSKLRVVWVLATVFTAFAGVVVYLALWFLMPKETPPAPTFEPAAMQPWKKSV